MPTAVKEETYELNQITSSISATSITVSTAEGMQVIWAYRVPVGNSLVFRQEDHFAAFLTGASEAAAGSLVDIVLSDASRNAIRPILFPLRYSQVRGSATTFLAFQDSDYFNHLDIAPGEVVIAEEQEWVLIRGNINATMVVGNCFFALTCHRIRHTLFE